jgi:hypothetical protein
MGWLVFKSCCKGFVIKSGHNFGIGFDELRAGDWFKLHCKSSIIASALQIPRREPTYLAASSSLLLLRTKIAPMADN